MSWYDTKLCWPLYFCVSLRSTAEPQCTFTFLDASGRLASPEQQGVRLASESLHADTEKPL